jgi:uncharacterized protein YgiM (DUF1202 family)
MESILTSIKKLLGIAEEYEHFDSDIIMHINSVFMTLTQLGVGPSEGFYITDEETVWSDYITDPNRLQAVKTYMYLKIRLVFDSASLGSATLAAYERQIQELEWRLNVETDTPREGDIPEIPAMSVYGVVVDCLKLNIRSAPSSSADIVQVLEANSKVNVDISKSVTDWYYVYTDSGNVGYCLKANIRIYL